MSHIIWRFIEGPTDDPAIEQLRNRQVKNFLAVTLLSLGVPMLLMGDEVRRTQHGNNNAYCQNNETSWFDWSLLEKHADILRFVKLLITRRLLRGGNDQERQWATLNQLVQQTDKAWHGVRLNQPDWGDGSHSLAFTVDLPPQRCRLHFIFNAYWEPLEFELPPTRDAGNKPWRRWLDTSLESPNDISDWPEAPPISGATYVASPRSVIVLLVD